MIKKMHIIVLTASLLLPILAAAQIDMELRDQVRNMVRTNGELLVKARGLVLETNSTKARILLKNSFTLNEEARKVMEKAEDYYAQSRIEMARWLMMKARDLAASARESVLRTIATARREMRMEETAVRNMEKARRSLEEAIALQSAYEGPDRRSAAKLIEESRTQLSRARDNMREHMYETALKLSQLSSSLSERASQLMKRGRGAYGEVERELSRTDAIIERLHDGLEENRDIYSREKYESARRLQERAQQEFEKERYQAALQLTRRARRLALEGMRLISQRGTRGVKKELELTASLLERAREIASEIQNPEAEGALQRAERIQAEARESFSRKELRRALELTRRARKTLRDALGSADRALEPGAVEATLRETDEIVSSTASLPGMEESRPARDLLERARKHQRAAWRFFERGNLESSLARTRLARRLAGRAGDLLADEKD